MQVKPATFERTDSMRSEDRRNHQRLARDLEASKSQVSVLFGIDTTATGGGGGSEQKSGNGAGGGSGGANGALHPQHSRPPSSASSRGSHPGEYTSGGTSPTHSKGSNSFFGGGATAGMPPGGSSSLEGSNNLLQHPTSTRDGNSPPPPSLIFSTTPSSALTGGSPTHPTTTTTTMTSGNLAINTYHAPGHHHAATTTSAAGGVSPGPNSGAFPIPRSYSTGSFGASGGGGNPPQQQQDLWDAAAGPVGGQGGGAGGGGYESTGGESSDGDAWMEQYRRERLDDIMRRTAGVNLTPQNDNDTDSNYSLATGGGGSFGGPPQGVGNSSPGNLATTTGGEGVGSRRSRSNSGLGWGSSQTTHRIPLTMGELDLCKRVDLELKRLSSSPAKSTCSHLTQLDKQTIIRVVQCKKNFDRSVEMCTILGSAIIDRFGLGHLTWEDVEPMLNRKAILRIDPSQVVSRDDGSSFIYLVLNRLAHPNFPTSDSLVQALLFLIEKHRAFESKMTIVLDATMFEVTPGNAKTITQLSQSVFDTLVGKYPARVSKILLLNPKGFGSMTQILIKGMMVKAISAKWRERVVTVKSLDSYVQNRGALKRELYQKLNW